MSGPRHALLLAAVVLACAPGGGDRSEVERTVRAYDDALVKAFRANDAGPLQEVATEKEAKRVSVLVDLKVADRLVLESTLERFEVLSAERFGPDGYTVRTAERWRYFDRPLDPGRPAGLRFLADMQMQYEVERASGRWRVAKVRTVSSDYLEPPGFTPGAPHGSSGSHR